MNYRERSRSEPTLEAQRLFWNQWNLQARSPQHLNDWARIRGAAILRTLSSLALHNPRIIDLGCGTGWLTERLAAFGPVTGIDLSDEAIAQARVRAPHIEYVAGNLFEMSLPQAHFDVAISQDVLAHVVDQAGYLSCAAGVLKPGGYLIITTTNRFVVRRMELPPQPVEHIERWLTMRSLRKSLEPHFDVSWTTTVMPAGSKGLLRVINSRKLEALLTTVMAQETLTALKQRLGLGYNLLAVATRRSHAERTSSRISRY